jgi:hypothetical protein
MITRNPIGGHPDRLRRSGLPLTPCSFKQLKLTGGMGEASRALPDWMSPRVGGGKFREAELEVPQKCRLETEKKTCHALLVWRSR